MAEPSANWKNLHLDTGEILRYAAVDIPIGASVFDAFVDPALTASVASKHVYKNLTELVANESPPGISSGATFNVGLVPRGSFFTCTEPSSVVIPASWPTLNLCAISGQGGSTTDTRNPSFWWNMPTVSVSSNVVMSGVHVPSQSVHSCFAGMGSAQTILVNCFFGSGNIVTDGPLFAYNSAFVVQQRLNGGVAGTVVELWNCYWNGSVTGVDWTLSVYGGYINGGLVTTGTGRTQVNARIQGDVQIGNTGGASINNLSGFNTSAIFEILSTSIKQVEVRGCFTRVILRGNGHRVDVKIPQDGGPTNPAIQLLSCNDTLVVADVDSQVTGAQAYTIDAGSSRNLLVIGGSGATNYTVASTDVGTGNRVITQAADSFALGKTLTNAHILVGNGSNVATDVAVTGDVTITNAGVTAIGALKVATGMIQANAVTLAKLATMADQRILGNVSGGAAIPAELTPANVKTMLAITESDVASLVADLALKAPLASPALTGTPTAPTAAEGTNTTQLATTAFVQTAKVDDWTLDTNTWTFVSATTGAGGGRNTFKVTGVDVTAYLKPGTKISWNDGTNVPGFGVVATSTFSVDTTVVMVDQSDYTLANHAIVSPKYSYGTPPDFPAFFNYSPTLAGWSVNPAGVYHWHAVGRMIYIQINLGTSGTSNNAIHTATLPVTAQTATFGWSVAGIFIDNGTTQVGAAAVTSAATTVILRGIMASQTNTASGTSAVNGVELWYAF